MKKLVAQINRRSSTDKLNIISENKIYGVMEGCYTKLLILFHESNRKLRDIRFDELFYEYMSAKYGIKSVIKQNSMHILSNILHYSSKTIFIYSYIYIYISGCRRRNGGVIWKLFGDRYP